jgi:CheY-like chemotaxis protein/nitrogen-specific signal transduction histidine kinase
MMAMATDITPQVTARLALERRNAERAELLEAAHVAARAKDEFLAMLGHELRNPLAPILTALELMKTKPAGHEREREIIERQALHLVHLVDDLLDVARIAEGKVQLKRQRVALAEVVATAIETASPLLQTHGHDLQVQVSPHGLDVDADPTRLAQVIANLLTNAARYTNPGGSIRIRAWQAGGRLVLRVEDNGIGIASEQLPLVFERFFQATRSDDRVHGGLGLGLALVKSLVELHGGSVRAESSGLGEGSAFELDLPLASPSIPSDSAPAAAPPARRTSAPTERVLLVDDNEDITDLFRQLLEHSGFDVETAHDGPSALRIATAFKPGVAVLDLGLPEMDGYEIAAKLRELGPDAPRLIAMSGYGRQDDIERTRQAGFERHLVKPIDTEALLRAIAQG